MATETTRTKRSQAAAKPANSRVAAGKAAVAKKASSKADESIKQRPPRKQAAAKKVAKPKSTGVGNIKKGASDLPQPKDAEFGIKRPEELHINAQDTGTSTDQPASHSESASIEHRAGLKDNRGRPMLTNAQRQALAREAGITPLEYMMSVMRDETEGPSARRWAAEIAAPYIHHRLPTAPQLAGSTNDGRSGVLVAPSGASQEEWIAKHGATPADVVDVEFKEVSLDVPETPIPPRVKTR